MTKSKCIRLLNELIEKYGDVEVGQVYDYYKSRLMKDNGTYIPTEECIINSIKLSDMVEVISCRSDYEHLEEIVKGSRNKRMYPVVIPESKNAYESEEQKKLRDKHRSDFSSMMSYICGGYPFHNVYENIKMYDDIAKLTEYNPSPKEFGMAMDNHKKRR